MEAEDWTIDAYFHIRGHYPADGLAFWFTEESFKPGSAFGYTEYFKGLGVFFDVYKNRDSHHEFPFISAMIGDGHKPFDHFNDGHGQLLGGAHKPIVNTDHPVQVRINYDRRRLKVLVKIEEGDWEPCIDASNVHLPKRGYIGFTASTGAYAAQHELILVTTAKIKHESSALGGTDILHNEPEAGSSMAIVLFIFAVFGGLVYFAYLNQDKKHHF